MSASRGIDRRTFFKLVGGGIVVFVGLDPSALFSQDRAHIYPEDFNAYLLIGANGRVTVFTGKIEMGQGVMTSQAQMAAEELGVAFESIDMVMGDTDKCPWDMGTFGSLTTRMFGPALRAAAAEARAVLLRLAANKLGVPKTSLVVKNGVISVAADAARSVSYGELSQGAQIARVVGEKAVLRAASEFQVMGGSPKRLDAPEKVTGDAKYAADVRLPGMLYARILRPPAHGATLSQLDTSAVAKLPGVTLIRRDGLIAVLHADPEAAAAALERLKADWRMPPAQVDQESIFEHILKSAGQPKQSSASGDLATGRANAARVFETSYRKGYVAHAPMEPHAALAAVKDGKATVWAGTQTPFPTRDRVAEALGFDAQERAPDHALRRRRLWRKEHERPGRRSGAPGADRGQAGAGRLDPRRRVFLRHLRSRRRGEHRLGHRQGRKNLALGLYRLRRGRARREPVLRHPQRAACDRRAACPTAPRTRGKACIRSRSDPGARPART